MTTEITPERQIAAQQVGSVFGSLHAYLDSLKTKNEAGERLMTEQMRNAHARIEEAGHWAVKHVLTFGVPPAADPASAEATTGSESATT